MGTLYLALGKGYRELAPPYRSIIIFGHELWDGAGFDLSAPCVLVEPTDRFDLSALEPNHEAVAALIIARAAPAGQYTLTQRWYRDRDSRLLFTLSASYYHQAAGDIYWGGWIGYVPWELTENGAYSVAVEITGAEPFDGKIPFFVQGIAGPAPAPLPTAVGIRGAAEALQLASQWFYAMYLQALGWVWPFYLLAAPFYQLCLLFSYAAQALYGFEGWVSWTEYQLATVLSWQTVIGTVSTTLAQLAPLLAWFTSWETAIGDLVNSWWAWMSQYVHGWIDFATQGLAGLLSSWSHFSTDVLPALVSWVNLTGWWDSRLQDVLSLVDTAFAARDSLWAGWSTWRDSVAEFFADPVQYVWSRFVDWFLGPEGR